MSFCPNCGNSLPSGVTECEMCATQELRRARTLQDIPQIAGYDVHHRLGEGGMGEVFLATELSLGRRVAVKIVSEKLAANPQSRARFLREARSLATIEHANVVRIYSFGDVGGLPYLAMEFIDGETLAQRLHRASKLSVDESIRIMRQVLLALEAAWEKGIVHRDIKPSNILIDGRDRVHVADFGLAKATLSGDDGHLTQTGDILGTPYYVSPEQAQGMPTDFRSDIYSCGILLYEMLTGERPFEGTTPFAIVARHIHDPLPSMRKKRPELSARIASLVEQMCEKQPDRRPQSYTELIGAFDGFLGITPTRAIGTTVTLPSLAGSRFGQSRTPWYVLVVLIAVLAVVLAYEILPRKRTAPGAPPDGRLAVAVTPFYGPDDDSAKEGRVMAALIERSITSRLGAANVRVAGIDDPKVPVRSHDEARALGEKLGASVVVWGEAFTLKSETEIQPYFTLVLPKKPAEEASQKSAAIEARNQDPLAEKGETASSAVHVQAEAPNQIELRKMSAEGIGEMVSLLAAIDAFYERGDLARSLQLLDQAPRTAEALRLRGRVDVQLARSHDRISHGVIDPRSTRAYAEAANAFEQALTLAPNDVQSRAELADVYFLQGRFTDAAAQYQKVAASAQPYVTHWGIASNGLIWIHDTYRSEWNGSGRRDDTGYLLGADPRDGTIVRRLKMPGTIRAFRPRPGGFSVEYAAIKDDQQIESVNFTGDRPDRPLPIGGNMLLRMRGMKSGWALVENFEHDYTGTIDEQAPHPKFRLTKHNLCSSSPRTLPDLETALRAAIRHDPTQPWHVFYLGQTLAAEGRRAEAESVWSQLLTKHYGVIWIDYAWMSKFFERLEQHEWADRLYERAVRERARLPQPVQVTLLIERLVNGGLSRIHPEQRKDAERAYLQFVRARNLSGPAEADHYYAAAWAAHFRRAGDLARAAAEEKYERRAAADPFNFTARSSIVDDSLFVLLAAVGSFISAALLLLVRANRRAHASDDGDAAPIASAVRPSRVMGGMVVLALMFSAVAFIAARIATWPWFSSVGTGFVIAAALIASLPSGRSGRLIASLSLRERLALSGLLLFFLAAAAAWIHGMNRMAAAASTPVGIADSLGHPFIVGQLEKRLAVRESPARLYVTAIADELGGNLDRAKQLYGELPGDSRAKRALASLSRGQTQIDFPTQDELAAAFFGRPSWFVLGRNALDIFGELGGSDPIASHFILIVAMIVYAACAAALLLLLPFALIPSAEIADPDPARAGTVRRVLRLPFYLLVPGAFDLLRRSCVRGAIVLTSATWGGICLYSAWHIVRALGVPSTWTTLPGGGMLLGNAAPLPLDTTRADLFFAAPHAAVFWGFALIAAIAAIALHGIRIPEIVAVLRREKAPHPAPLVASEQSA